MPFTPSTIAAMPIASPIARKALLKTTVFLWLTKKSFFFAGCTFRGISTKFSVCSVFFLLQQHLHFITSLLKLIIIYINNYLYDK